MRKRPLAAVGLTALVIVCMGGCLRAPDAIVIDGSTVRIANQTPRPWRNVVVTLNDHFRGGASSLPVGGILTAPLSQFQTAYGQRFLPAGQGVAKIEVTATDSDENAVLLRWDRPSRRGTR